MTCTLFLLYESYENTCFKQTHLLKVKFVKGIYRSTCMALWCASRMIFNLMLSQPFLRYVCLQCLINKHHDAFHEKTPSFQSLAKSEMSPNFKLFWVLLKFQGNQIFNLATDLLSQKAVCT